MPNNQGGMSGIEAISGVQAPSSSAVEKITLQNYDSNPAQINRMYNQTQFLGLTAQHTTTKFDSRAFDIAFNDGAGMVGMNPFFRPPETATKIFMA
ncbi:unknown [Clostridium sp. CAG:715]|nr:unknown [Clostridium sp. CAG:715]